MLCGGLAGIVTWASVFPLDVIKTRVQTQVSTRHSLPNLAEHQSLLRPATSKRLSTFEVARLAYQTEGARVFFRGLGVCSVRAFIVNAVQWAVYEWMMQVLRRA
jgi:solute carrier family 25 carnitine/acylcarnitine transporter 20/29